MEETLNLKHYVSVLTHLAFNACHIAKQCAENPNLKKYEKGVNDPVTEADYKIQTMLIRGISHFFPKLKIVGEETTEYPGLIELDLNAIALDNCPAGFDLQQSAPINEFCVWIDPIDNTKGFINGTLDCVTVLIGLSRNQRAFLGVLGLPYNKSNESIQFQPEILVGAVPSAKAFSTYALKTWNQIHLPQPNNPLKFSISDSRGYSNIVEQILKKNNATLIRVGGSGKKIAQVIKGETDGLLYLKAANHKWDSCAGEAIILAIGGTFTDSFGSPILYDPHAKSTVNEYGNICFSDPSLHQSILINLKSKM